MTLLQDRDRLEDRLRRDLPALADALEDAPRDASVPSVSSFPGTSSGRRLSRRHLLTAAAGAGVIAGAGIVIGRRRRTLGSSITSSEVDPSAPVGAPPIAAWPTDFGSWAAMPPAPIVPRPYAASAWTGSDVVFWAGSSLSRGFAFSDGAAYDPAAGTWRTLRVPGWGHPGLTSTWVDGRMYVTAKGAVSWYDPATGESGDVAHPGTIRIAALAAVGSRLWAVGPADVVGVSDGEIGAIAFDLRAQRWSDPVTAPVDLGGRVIVQRLVTLEAAVVVHGRDVVVRGNGVAGLLVFDTQALAWRQVDPPDTDAISATIVASDDASIGLVAVDLTGDDPRRTLVCSRLVESTDDATWVPIGEPVAAAGASHVVAAVLGEWLVAVLDVGSPIVVHLPTGISSIAVEGPIAGVRAPNVVVTPTSVVIWGGDVSSADDIPDGVLWTPPS